MKLSKQRRNSYEQYGAILDFEGHDHQLFSELHLDQAGEFGGDPEFLAILKRNNCKHVPNDQIEKRDNVVAEYIIGVI